MPLILCPNCLVSNPIVPEDNLDYQYCYKCGEHFPTNNEKSRAALSSNSVDVNSYASEYVQEPNVTAAYLQKAFSHHRLTDFAKSNAWDEANECTEKNSFLPASQILKDTSRTNWSCSACTFLNSTDDVQCAMCAIGEQPESTSNVSEIETASVTNSQDRLNLPEWSCTHCSYNNLNFCNTCDMCRAPKDSKVKPLEDTPKIIWFPSETEKTRATSTSSIQDHPTHYRLDLTKPSDTFPTSFYRTTDDVYRRSTSPKTVETIQRTPVVEDATPGNHRRTSFSASSRHRDDIGSFRPPSLFKSADVHRPVKLSKPSRYSSMDRLTESTDKRPFTSASARVAIRPIPHSKHETFKNKYCSYYALCKEYLLSLRWSKTFFNTAFNRCYCENCYSTNSQNALRVANATYVIPRGWVRFGLQVDRVRAEVEHIWDKWVVSYHGTSPIAAKSIVTHRQFLLPGDTCVDGHTKIEIRPGHIPGMNQVYTSPTIHYSGLDCYAKTNYFTASNGHQYQAKIVLQCRQQPGSFKTQAQTVCAGSNRLCPIIPNESIEMLTVSRAAVVPYGLLIQMKRI